MKLVNQSVKRPVGVVMIVLAIIALGVISVRNLAIDLLPEIDLPIAVVAVNYPDAAPEEVEKQVSKPIEASLSSIEGIESIQTQSQSGSSLVIMMFNTGTNLDNALLEVRESVDRVKGMLPSSAGEPNVLRFNPNQMPIMQVSVSGDNLARLQTIAEDQVISEFERQPGVASVSLEGGQERVIELELDRAKLAQYGLSSQQIMQTLSQVNRSASAGTVAKGDQDLQVRIEGEYTSIDDIRETISQTPQGATVHIEDVATVIDTFADSSTTLVNGKESVVLSVTKQSDGNTVDVSNNILASIDELNEEVLPSDVELDIVIDTSSFIKQSIASVVQNMVLGGVFALLILLLFLKSFRATLVVGVAIPIAIVATFTLIYFTGETLNILTMGGLALGLGMMVDSSIVILENIVSYRQKGYSMKKAATKGASELAPAVIASTTTTLVVFLPIVFVEGIASELFTPLALTIAFALVASLIVSITLIPMLSSKLLSKVSEDNGRRYWFDQFLKRFNKGYEGILRKVLKYKKTTIFTTLVVIGASLALIPFIGTEFIPQGDQGQITVSVETPVGTNAEKTEAVATEVNERLAAYEDIIDVNYVTISSGDARNRVMGGGSSNEASYTIQLIPQGERDRSTEEVSQAIAKDLEGIVGAEITVSEMGAAISTGDPVQIQLNGPEHEVLQELAGQVVTEIATIEGVHNPTSSVSETQPQLNIQVDKEVAAKYGLTEQSIMSQVQMQFTGQTVMRYREDGDEINVRLTYPEESRESISDLKTLLIQNQQGTMIPLETVATFEQVQAPATLTRQNQQQQVNVTTGVVGSDLGTVSAAIDARLDAMNLPEDYTYSIGGQAEDMQEAFSDLGLALVLSIFLVYAVMAVQFENFLFPFVIMFSLPATVVGVIGGLFVTGTPLSITAFIGVIMLAGIVVNNAIVLVDYINILRARGMERYEAIIEAGITRMRPILMTTLTTILAMIPLGLGIGEGAEMQQPMAITVIFGLTVSSIFTLLLIPVVYTYFDTLSEKVKRRFVKEEEV
ncbi:multidrug ABC transporter [Paraliobacillus quinghaiensis]|uniref:Multidrug ABC transporter n=1 Tax=Paraliobacillus quinghaiensis TaxID=470815 RepID=A0A917WVL0_9BACI|nr:efflux RND transporter permease subunit [Paraliobacillus quinghaiensis]GGM32361.1 multidrug ABC transporter [Paraliobacillus quinghaiensis]